MAENWVNDARSEARTAFDARSKVEVEPGALKEKQSKLTEQMKEAVKARDSTEASFKTTEKQVEDLRKQLHYTEINLATEKQLVMDLREELRKAREAVQLVKKAAEAEKQAAYTLRVEETQARLTKELSDVCKDYYSISWDKAFDATGVPVGSDLRWPESIYYNPEIRELPGPDSSHPKQATQVSAQPKADQVPPASSEVPKSSNQDGGQGKKIETLKGKDKDQEKKKNSSDPTEKAPNTVAPQLGPIVDPVVSTTKA